MRIYSIKEEIRANVIIDVFTIEDKKFKEIDTYLFNFPLNKTLVYSYLKYTDKKVKISYLHDIFKDVGELRYLDSKEHKHLLENDIVYNKVITKFIRNKYIWCNVLHGLQPHFFDAKYLLLGEYQKVASKCANNFFHTQAMHYSGLVNSIRITQKHIDKFNTFFIEKKNLEVEYFDIILKDIRKNKNVIAYGYYNKIEIYDIKTELVLQIDLGENGLHEINTLFPTIKKVRNKQESKRLATNILVKNEDLISLYNKLLSREYMKLTNKYLSNLNDLKKTNVYKILKYSVKQMLVDLHSEDKTTYFNSKFIDGYFVHNNVMECTRINISEVNNFLRLQRKIYVDLFGVSKTIELSSYMTYNDFNTNTDFLLMSGLINIGKLERKHNMYEYKLLSSGDNDNYSLSFMKANVFDTYYLWEDYIKLQPSLKKDIEYAIKNKKEIKDTRNTHLRDVNFNTQFELYEYEENPKTYRENRDSIVNNKNKNIIKFKKTISKYLDNLDL